MAGHDRLTKEGKKFFSEIEQLKRLQARVGFQRGEATEEDGTDLVDIAVWNELGTSRIPSRPFLRKSVDENADAISSFCTSQVKRITSGQATAKEVLNAIGTKQKALIQKKIRDGTFVPNAEVTKIRKKSNKPLIDTGRLRQSVNYVIKEKE